MWRGDFGGAGVIFLKIFRDKFYWIKKKLYFCILFLTSETSAFVSKQVRSCQNMCIRVTGHRSLITNLCLKNLQ